MSNTREIYEKACHMNQKAHDNAYYWQLNYWKRLYDSLHPSQSQANTETRQKCMEVLKKALPWHLDNTLNIDEKSRIKEAIKEIAQYAG